MSTGPLIFGLFGFVNRQHGWCLRTQRNIFFVIFWGGLDLRMCRRCGRSAAGSSTRAATERRCAAGSGPLWYRSNRTAVAVTVVDEWTSGMVCEPREGGFRAQRMRCGCGPARPKQRADITRPCGHTGRGIYPNEWQVACHVGECVPAGAGGDVHSVEPGVMVATLARH
jgi:hypothetical protein